MTTEHPITPPTELVRQWAVYKTGHESPVQLWYNVANQAAQWGADQELEACCEWVSQWCGRWLDGTRPEDELRAARRPKPPSLAEEALAEIQQMEGAMYSADLGCDFTATRAALERLQELEKGDE